jgi:dTDP-6-deoxy-L-talose 4-dehydrogenase (NAD+)
MKVLVIGNGFIAGPVIHKLESEGHQVLIFARTYKSGIKSNQIIGDFLNFNDFAPVLKWKPQVIVHTGWVTAHGRYPEDPLNYLYSEFTIKLARYIVSTNIEHLIVLGTCAEYGLQSAPSVAGVTQLDPSSLYAMQKVHAYKECSKILAAANIRFSWARIFQPYGLNQDSKRLIPYLIKSIKLGKQIELKDSTTILDWITTRDIASAITWIIGNISPTEVDIGTSVGYSNLDLLRHLESSLGNSIQWKRFTSQTLKAPHVSLVGKDSPLLKLGWRPSDNLSQGLEWVLRS